MTRRKRRTFSPQEKLNIVRMHFLERRPISELCEEEGISPTLFYQWQRTFFENGTSAFEPKKRQASGEQITIERLRKQLQHKDEVLAEIAAEMVRLKKELGENSR